MRRVESSAVEERRAWVPVWVAGALGLLLGVNACAWLAQSPSLCDLPAARRYWEDVSIATANFLDGSRPTGAPPTSIQSAPEYRPRLQRYLCRAAAERQLRFWEFWRTIPVLPRFNIGPLHGRDNDDSGRSMLLALAFRGLGGVAPWLPRWLGLLACLSLLPWVLWQFHRSGQAVAGTVFLLGCVCSPFFVDTLALPYSALGFYLVSLVNLAGLSAYASARRESPLWTDLVSLAIAGAVFAVCVLARGGALLQLPGYVLAVTVLALRPAARLKSRLTRSSGRARLLSPWLLPQAATAAMAFAVFLAPYAALRPAHHHEVWLGIWEGLGDFDRDRGHFWGDSAAKEVLRAEGIAVDSRVGIFSIESSQTDAVFRRRVLASVRADPSWYAGILGRRVWAILVQWKLLPFAACSGQSLAPAAHPNEGAIDTYYALTTPADWLGLGPWRAELPVPALWSPLALVLLLAWAARHRPEVTRRVQVLGCLALGTLGLPVLITTASAIETEAFVLVYFLAFGVLVEILARRLWRR